MSDAHKQTLLAANAAIARLDFEGFLAHCTDDTTWTFVGERTLHGKEAVREWMQSEYKEAPIFDIHNLVAESDTVVAMGRITLKDNAGQSTRYAYCDVWKFRRGQMAELQAFVVEV